jgi:hypothetical protein
MMSAKTAVQSHRDHRSRLQIRTIWRARPDFACITISFPIRGNSIFGGGSRVGFTGKILQATRLPLQIHFRQARLPLSLSPGRSNKTL